KRHRGSRMKRRARHGSSSSASAEDPKSLRDYCYEFTQGKNRWLHTFREFSLTKVVPVNTLYLQTHLERIIRSTNYRGHTEITFPVHGKTVTIVPATWVTTARYTRWR